MISGRFLKKFEFLKKKNLKITCHLLSTSTEHAKVKSKLKK